MYKEKITILVNKIKSSEGEFCMDDLKTIEEIIDGCADYVQAVIQMESAIQIARFRMEGDQFRSYVENLDKSRRANHNACIANIKMLNRLCTLYRCDKIFSDEELEMDRTDIADKIIKIIVDEYFDERKK